MCFPNDTQCPISKKVYGNDYIIIIQQFQEHWQLIFMQLTKDENKKLPRPSKTRTRERNKNYKDQNKLEFTPITISDTTPFSTENSRYLVKSSELYL